METVEQGAWQRSKMAEHNAASNAKLNMDCGVYVVCLNYEHSVSPYARLPHGASPSSLAFVFVFDPTLFPPTSFTTCRCRIEVPPSRSHPFFPHQFHYVPSLHRGPSLGAPACVRSFGSTSLLFLTNDGHKNSYHCDFQYIYIHV